VHGTDLMFGRYDQSVWTSTNVCPTGAHTRARGLHFPRYSGQSPFCAPRGLRAPDRSEGTVTWLFSASFWGGRGFCGSLGEHYPVVASVAAAFVPPPVCRRVCAAACGEYTTRKARMHTPCTPVTDRPGSFNFRVETAEVNALGYK